MVKVEDEKVKKTQTRMHCYCLKMKTAKQNIFKSHAATGCTCSQSSVTAAQWKNLTLPFIQEKPVERPTHALPGTKNKLKHSTDWLKVEVEAIMIFIII